MKKIIPIAFLLIILIGCSVSEQPTQPVVEDSGISADKILDEQIYADAVIYLNLERCSEIIDQAKSVECKDVVDSLIIKDEALSNLDKTVCDRIKLERYREECKNSVENKINFKQEEEYKVQQKQELQAEVEAIQQKAVDEENADACNEIIDENQKYACRFNVLANKAYLEKNPAICGEIGNEDFKKACEDFLISVENQI